MKTKREFSPAVITRLLLAEMSVLLGFMVLAGCGGQKAPLTDNGRNAGLSNEELVSRAVENMGNLPSYHIDVSGPVQGAQNTLSLDVQVNERVYSQGTPVAGIRLKSSTEAHGEYPASEYELIWPRVSEDELYTSTDGGKSWTVMTGVGTFAVDLWIGMYAAPWQALYSPSAPSVFKDGDPRLEMIGTTLLTRHVVADLTGLAKQDRPKWDMLGASPTQLEMWISTGETPLVYRCVARGDTTLQWTWSRFNEDLGEVVAPPTETVKEP